MVNDKIVHLLASLGIPLSHSEFLLLDGSRKMTGKFRGLCAQFEPGHSTKLEVVTQLFGTVYYPALSPTDSSGTKYMFLIGEILVVDPSYNMPVIALYSDDFSNCGYIVVNVPTYGGMEFGLLSGNMKFVPYAGDVVFAPFGDAIFNPTGDINLNPTGETKIPRAGDISLLDDKFLKIGRDSDDTLPPASAAYRGKIIYTQGTTFPPPGTPDHAYICLKQEGTTYSWVQIA